MSDEPRYRAAIAAKNEFLIKKGTLHPSTENILPVIMGKHQNVIRMANFMKFHLVNSAHFLSHFFLAEMTHKELLAFFASGAKGDFKTQNGSLYIF